METDSAPAAVSHCEELFSGIRTDSFDALSSQFYNFSASLPICSFDSIHANVAHSFDNIHANGTNSFNCANSSMTEDANSLCLHTVSSRHGDSHLPAVASVSGYPNLSTLHTTVVPFDDKTTQQLHIHMNNQHLVRIEEGGTVCAELSTEAKQDLIVTSINSFDSLGKDFDLNNKSDIKTCSKFKSDNPVTVPSSVKIVTTESESGTLQMFLVDDPDIDFVVEKSCSSSVQSNTKQSIQISAIEEIPIYSQKENENQERSPIKVSEVEETREDESLKNTNDNSKKADSSSKPSRRSLRLKIGTRPTPSFTYNTSSGKENLADVESENVTNRTLMTRTSRISKSKPGVRSSAPSSKQYYCDMCSITCKTVSNLRQHKQTHNLNISTICTQCGYSCKNKSDMKKHEETHGPNNRYRCTECDYSGKRLKYLKKHMHVHDKDNTFSCHLCVYKVQNKADLGSHLLEHSSLKHSCVDCGESFKKKSALNKHMLAHSNGSLFTCAVCNAVFKEEDQLKRHEDEHNQDSHRNQSSDTKSSKIHQDTNTMSGGDVLGDYKGEIQSTNASNSKTTITDVNINDSNKIRQETPGMFLKVKGEPVQCTLCSYSCTSKNLLWRHMRRHSDSKPYVCPQCGAAFKRKDHLKVHKLTHSDLRPYKCPHCLYGTHRKYRLKLHILTHQTIKPVKCSMCMYSCRRDCELKYHMRNKHGIEADPNLAHASRAEPSEFGDIVLKCELCDYTCDSQKRLKYHMTRHENKTPHSCLHCDYKCSSRSSLTDHLLQHAGIKPCLCSICGMAFRNTSRLNRHKLVHSDVKPYGCSFCDFSSRSKYNLKQHVLRHTDQEKTRRRNRRPPKSLISDSSNTEVTKQPCQSDVQSLADHVESDLYLDNVQPLTNGNQMNVEAKNSSKFMESFQPVHMPQYYNKTQMDITNDCYKNYDNRNIDHSAGGGYNTVYQGTSMGIHPYQMDRTSCPNAMNLTSTYKDPYQNSNPLLVHPHPMSYNLNANSGHTNPNFCYMDRNSASYGFANSYLYSDTVFPGNMTTNMNFYMCPNSSNTYTLNPCQALPINQNIVHFNPPITHMDLPVIPSAPAPLLPVMENQSQSISETEESHFANLTMSEDISLDVSVNQENEIVKQGFQAKKTGATLNGGNIITKNDHGENAGKMTHMCSECGYICLTNTMLQRHKTTHVDLKPHKCDECGKSFKRLDHMKAHKRIHNQDKPFSCKHCSYTCSRKYRLKLHEMTHINEHPLSCNVCESTFVAQQELEEHAKIHSDGFMFACNKCDFKCKEKTELRFHNESHKTFLCEECSYVCRSSREFNSHKRMHAEKEELTCSLCSYTCDSQKRLKYHMERHNNKTPHECSHCDYKCSSRSSLTDHLLQHEGLKPFLCSVCGMKFRNVSRLNRHKMTHTDIKPHACEYCHFSSRSRYNLKQHMLRHFK